jgi:hypothetical protein
MARTESKSIQVHPYDEQAQIDLMQKFHWNLLNSQEVKTVDNRLERRGDSIYQVSNSEHYVKLTFSRDLDLPNLDEIKRLEQKFFSLPHPNYPSAFGCFTAQLLVVLFISLAIAISLAIDSGLVGTVLSFILIVGAYVAYLFMYYIPKKQEADQIMAETKKCKREILEAVAQYD